ncbi:hypothetical protein Marpi_2132 (plasmid) [Marinitoga piezophila KA3]|uniref:Uncharacterized protein n=1 Tax=Marinitoga piezophila (strain DSM 14283 / JCM 11233 / KA3) TaxID=443254 RepID=H2J8G1_MARPK|nr:hypothetical protein [Marinitoga piezophila]AEX86505.1 hypothetical protein Marpi_2132 [Marinitoga piezophila KA3]
MGVKEVELLKDEIRQYLLSGYSMSATEKKLGLTRNDIPRYYKRITGEDPKNLVEEAKKKKVLGKLRKNDSKPIIAKDIQESESPGIIKRIEELEKRIEELEKLVKDAKKIESAKKDLSLSSEFITTYNTGEKKLYSVRILNNLKEKIIKEAKRNNVSANQLINMILFEYFKRK